MPKFFVNQDQVHENRIEIIGQDVNHIRNVLRLEINEEIQICIKEQETTYNCIIEEIEKEYVLCNIKEKVEDTTESNVSIHVFQGLPKADKLEFIIEKCTEIGVKKITPVIMSRSIVKLNEKDKNKKLERWRKIAEVAAKQSGRDKILEVNSVLNFKNIFENLQEYDIVLVAYEKEKKNSLKNVLNKIKDENKTYKIAVLIGPEGGIDSIEIEELKKNVNNIEIVTLGKRILRTETAPIVISSNILYELEEN